MTSVPLASGPLPVVLLGLGAAALAWLCWRGGRNSLRALGVSVLAAGVMTLLLFLLAEHLFFWWNASFPRYLYLYAFGGMLAVQLAVQLFRAPVRPVARAAAAAGACLVLLAVAVGTNAAYGQYPTLGALLAPPRPLPGPVPTRSPDAGAGAAAANRENWQAPDGMPARGSVYEADIPGTLSGYAAGPAWVYLPPAWLASPPAENLPVLVLLHGQPGGPSDWFVSGRIGEALDEFAERNDGLAPVVVIPDLSAAAGARWPLCLDSTAGRSATYLAADVPAWVRENLASGLDGGEQWAAAGYSYGGTCALQLAVNFKDSYPTFIDVAGESAPTVPTGRQALIDTYFAGDAEAFAEQNALDRLRQQSMAGSAGIVVIGRNDGLYAPEGREVYAALKAAGAHVTLQELPGSHSWQVWRAGVVQNLDWLGRRLGLDGRDPAGR